MPIRQEIGKALALVSLVSPVYAANIVADVASGTAQCGVFLDAAAKVVIPAVGTTCTYDVSTVSVGLHSIKMTAISVNDPVWGSQESAQSAAFSFTRPGTPAAPSGLRLTP